MVAKKKDFSKLAMEMRSAGTLEQTQLSPEQRGIQELVLPRVKAAPTRKRFTVNLPMDLIELARVTVATTLGLTVSGLVEAALREKLAGLAPGLSAESKPQATVAPRKGRPVILKR